MNVIIAGCGRVGSELAQSVSRQGHRVAVIDPDNAAFDRLGDDFKGRTIRGDVRDKDVLLRAGIENAEGFAAVTISDDLNLVAALTARNFFDVPNVVARVYDPKHAEVFVQAQLQTVISSHWGAHRIEQLLTHPGTHQLLSLGNGEVHMIEVQAPEELVGQPASSLAMDNWCLPSVLVRGGVAKIIESSDILQEGDLIVCNVSHPNLQDFYQHFGLEED
ncbi:MAG: TrkA family potassium uptake protein [Anaerolineales bacterium]|jgi:trk system potassium uptake protein TrkA